MVGKGNYKTFCKNCCPKRFENLPWLTTEQFTYDLFYNTLNHTIYPKQEQRKIVNAINKLNIVLRASMINRNDTIRDTIRGR